MVIKYDDNLNVIGYGLVGLIATGNNDFEINATEDIFNKRPHTHFKVNSTMDGIELRDQDNINREEEVIKLIEIRSDRDKLLTESDYRDLPSYPGLNQEAWRVYRQKLRDIPQDYTNVEDIVWPVKP